MRGNDAVLWKGEEFVGLDHKMLWFEGKKQTKGTVNVTNGKNRMPESAGVLLLV